MNTREAWTNYMNCVNEGAKRLFEDAWTHLLLNHDNFGEFETSKKVDHIIQCLSAEAPKNKYRTLETRSVLARKLVDHMVTGLNIPENEVLTNLVGMVSTLDDKRYEAEFEPLFIDEYVSLMGGVLDADQISQGIRKTSSAYAKGLVLIRDEFELDRCKNDITTLRSLHKIMGSMGKDSVDLGALYRCRANLGLYNELVSANPTANADSSAEEMSTNN